MKPEIIFEDNLLVGESPVWDCKENKLYFVDIRGQAYYCMDYKSGKYEKYDVPQLIGCLALCDDGNLLISMEDGIYISDGSAEIKPAHKPLKIKGDRFNDGKVGPDGCYYVGTAGDNFSGAFYRLRNGNLEELFDKCGCSNGLDWSDDAKIMYYCDSREQKIEKFSFDGNSHSLSDRQTVCGIPPYIGCGDGMTIDADGNLWVAIWGGSCVYHIEANSGKILDVIDIPAKQVSSCCFAGDNLTELIVTTAAVRTDLKGQPLAGKIFKIDTGVRGVRFNSYHI